MPELMDLVLDSINLRAALDNRQAFDLPGYECTERQARELVEKFNKGTAGVLANIASLGGFQYFSWAIDKVASDRHESRR